MKRFFLLSIVLLLAYGGVQAQAMKTKKPSKNTETVDNLLLIGYTPRSIVWPFLVLTVVLNLLVLAAAIAVTIIARRCYLPLLGDLYDGFQPAAFLPTLLVGAAIFVLVTVLNYVAIARKVSLIWHMHE